LFSADHLSVFRGPFSQNSPSWSTVSLPFTAELVSTQDKGEITHFYSGSPSVDENGTKTGHEYWLSEYQFEDAKKNNFEPFCSHFWLYF
jgi:hypothetical protein